MEEEFEQNDLWECFVCGKPSHSDLAPSGWLSNSHPLCKFCADRILMDLHHVQRNRMSYHYRLGEIRVVGKIPCFDGKHLWN